MEDLECFIKGLSPRTLLERVINPYPWLESFVANVRYGFPARNMYVVMITGRTANYTTTWPVFCKRRAIGRCLQYCVS